MLRFGTEDRVFGDPFYGVVVEKEPFAVEFGVVYVVALVDVYTDVRDDGEEVVCAVSIVGLIGDGVGGIGSHVQRYREPNMFIDFCLAAIEALNIS